MLFFKKKLTKTAQVLSLVLASTTAGFSYADTTAVAGRPYELALLSIHMISPWPFTLLM